MIAATLVIDLRSAAKFSPSHDGHLIEHTAFLKVSHQRRHRVVNHRHKMPHAGKVL